MPLTSSVKYPVGIRVDYGFRTKNSRGTRSEMTKDVVLISRFYSTSPSGVGGFPRSGGASDLSPLREGKDELKDVVRY